MSTVLTTTISRLLLLPSLMVAAAMLVKGYADIGDGFNAGIIASLGVLIQYVAFGFRRAETLLPLRRAADFALAGLGIALIIALIPVIAGEPIFTHYPPAGSDVIHIGSLELLTAVVFDIGVFMLVFGAAVSAMRLIARAFEGGDRE